MVGRTHDVPGRFLASPLWRGASGVAVLTLLCHASAAGAGPSRVDGVKAVEVGVFEPTTVQKDSADAPSGVVLLQKDVRLTQSTTEICPRPGVVFGLRYAVEGAPQGAPVEIVVRVNFPRAGVRYPGSRKRERYAEQTYTRDIGVVRFADYTIGGYWDALPGHWSIEFWSDGRLIGEQGFDLKKSACKAARN
jgi:Domain of unknown function (DUF3859)